MRSVESYLSEGVDKMNLKNGLKLLVGILISLVIGANCSLFAQSGLQMSIEEIKLWKNV